MCAVPNMAVFCSSLILCILGFLLRYFLNGSEMIPVVVVVTTTAVTITVTDGPQLQELLLTKCVWEGING
jgi:hypothetical protein